MPQECSHPEWRIVRRVQSNGVAIHVRQCQICGCNGGAIKRGGPEVRGLVDIPDWDQDLTDRWRTNRAAVWQYRRALREDYANRPLDEVWEEYRDYLQSDAWRHRRTLVLERDQYLCQACLINRAEQVHHLTYAHMGQEFLFELVAVCRDCHRRLHPEKDGPA